MAENKDPQYLSDITWLQGKAAYCDNEEQLAFHIVNHTIKIAPYAQAVLWVRQVTGIKIIAVSGVSIINRSSPYISFLEKKFIPAILKDYEHTIKLPTERYENIIKQYNGKFFNWCLSLPFDSYNKADKEKYKGYRDETGLILFANNEWNDEQTQKFDNLVKYYKYLWDLFLKQSDYKIHKSHTFKKYKFFIFFAALIFFMFPIRDSILVPAEISPEKPSVVAPSLSGMIADIFVEPNDLVTKDQVLFRLDTITLENNLQQSEKSLAAIQEKYRKAYQHSYNDSKSRSEVSLLQTEVKIAEADVEYNKLLLDRANIKAQFNGTVIFSDPKNWLGRPVDIGERVMLLADDQRKQLDIFIPVADLILLPDDAEVVFYPNPRPLDTISGTVKYISKQAEEQPDLSLAYYTVATVNQEDAKRYQFGIKGTAKIKGRRVPLGYYLLRRPIYWLRRTMGV